MFWESGQKLEKRSKRIIAMVRGVYLMFVFLRLLYICSILTLDFDALVIANKRVYLCLIDNRFNVNPRFIFIDLATK